MAAGITIRDAHAKIIEELIEEGGYAERIEGFLDQCDPMASEIVYRI